MKRWQWVLIAAFAFLVAGEALVFAQPAPNNCGLNMLCRVRTLIVSGATVLDGGTTMNGDLYINGDAGVSKNVGVGGTFRVDGVTTAGSAINAPVFDGGTFVAASTDRVCLNGVGCTVNVAFGGTGTGQAGDSAANAWACTGLIDNGTAKIRGGLSNDQSSANCSSNTGAVCVNDAHGLCWTDGSGNTVGCLTATGAITSTMVWDWTLSAASLPLTGTGTIAKWAGTGGAATLVGANWTPGIVGVGAGNFIVKLCNDAACSVIYATCTAACTAAVVTPVACTVDTAAVAKGVTPFLNITTACATTNPQGVFAAGLTQP